MTGGATGRGGQILAGDRLGAGPRVVLVHGVGIGPWSFASLAAELAADHEVLVAHRRGYGASAGLALTPTIDDQVADLVALAGGPAGFVGVSGGATLVLALALARPDLVRAAVVHEPAVGPIAPELHDRLSAAADRLASTPGGAGALAFVETLVGPAAWSSLGAAETADIAARQAVMRAEVPLFVLFEPAAVQLHALQRVPLMCSVGAASPGFRHSAAAAVATCVGREPVVVAGAGHLAQLDAPAALATALRAAGNTALRAAGNTALRAAGE